MKKDINVEDVKFKNIIADNKGRISDLRRRINISYRYKFLEDVLYNLYQDKYISYGSGDKFLIVCDFINSIEPSNKVIYEMTNFQNMGLTYEYLIGKDRYINCNECGTLVKATSSTSKYCKDCRREKELENKRKYINKIRSK